MILVTVGTQIPFPRMLNLVSKWSEKNNNTEIIAQVGIGGTFYQNFRCVELFGKDEFDKILSKADLVVSHAGMGSILSSLTQGKPIIVMPRLASLSEHRNDHQTATARAMQNKPSVNVVWNENELMQALDNINKFQLSEKISCFAPDEIINALSNLINE